jgi:hypothetical protein
LPFLPLLDLIRSILLVSYYLLAYNLLAILLILQGYLLIC